jgi:integrase
MMFGASVTDTWIGPVFETELLHVLMLPDFVRAGRIASWLLGAGMDVVAVSERLGHRSPSLTLSVYAHAIRGRQKELAQVDRRGAQVGGRF